MALDSTPNSIQHHHALAQDASYVRVHPAAYNRGKTARSPRRR